MADSAKHTTHDDSHDTRGETRQEDRRGEKQPELGQADEKREDRPVFSDAWKRDRADDARLNGTLGVAAYKNLGSVTPR